MAINRVPMKEFFISRGIIINSSDSGCPWCERVAESTNHLFFECSFVKRFWSCIFCWWGLRWKDVANFEEFFSLCWRVSLSGIQKSLWLLAVSAACWSGWISRNEKVFEGKATTLDLLIYQTKLRSFVGQEWSMRNVFSQSDWWGWPRKS
ncbi:hypothetical protein Golob_025582, partial [Gossypium lobatum]|nr:hypothetical protein [Gossypium lobatum]